MLIDHNASLSLYIEYGRQKGTRDGRILQTSGGQEFLDSIHNRSG